MKFRKQNNDLTVNGVRQGFDPRDAISLRREMDYTPKTQIWSYKEFEPEPEESTYWCAICEPNQGWKLEDQHYIRKYDDPSNDPDLQILVEDSYED